MTNQPISFKEALLSDDVDKVKAFIASSPSMDDLSALMSNYVDSPEVLSWLVSKSSSEVVENLNLLRDACVLGHVESVRVLIQSPHSDFYLRQSINHTITSGNREVLDVFIDHLPPTFFQDRDFTGLGRAALHGHLEMVQSLFPLCHHIHGGVALIEAGRGEHTNVMDFLTDCGKVNPLSAFNVFLDDGMWTAADYLARHISLDVLIRLKETDPDTIKIHLPWVSSHLQKISLQQTVPFANHSQNAKPRI